MRQTAALARLFEPSFRADGEGHGLGLAIARRIALAHGGDITAENAPDGGLRVCIRLPLSPTLSSAGNKP